MFCVLPNSVASVKLAQCPVTCVCLWLFSRRMFSLCCEHVQFSEQCSCASDKTSAVLRAVSLVDQPSISQVLSSWRNPHKSKDFSFSVPEVRVDDHDVQPCPLCHLWRVHTVLRSSARDPSSWHACTVTLVCKTRYLTYLHLLTKWVLNVQYFRRGRITQFWKNQSSH